MLSPSKRSIMMKADSRSANHQMDSIGAPLIVAALAIVAVLIAASRWIKQFASKPDAVPALSTVSPGFAERFGIPHPTRG
jgi:hypothetical protein